MTAATKATTVSGETIILDFKAGRAAGILTYDKMCKAIDLMDKWKPEAISHFILQFVDIAHLLDASCKLLVKKLARIEWHIVPPPTRDRFVDALCELAVQHVCHTETMITSFIEHFAAKIRAVASSDEGVSEMDMVPSNRTQKMELALSEQEQNAIYALAHRSLARVLKLFPMAVKLLPKTVRHGFPHHSQPRLRYESFIRNALLLSEYAIDVRPQIWSLIFDSLAQIDAMLSKRVLTSESQMVPEDDDHSDDSSGVFLLDEENDPLRTTVLCEDERSKDRIDKLDACLGYVFSYIAKAHQQQLPLDLVDMWEWLPRECTKEGLSAQLRSIFEAHVLMAHDVNHVSFIWLFAFSIEPECMEEMMRWLWGFVTRPGQSPNDWKKAQGAACYIGAFLSRANVVDLSMTMEWMERILRWCRSYLNQAVHRENTLGTIRHGTFYALCQSLLLTFCFRYNQIVQANELETVRQWGFGHIVHSPLEPLTFISRPVAQCFATISRSLQLVYCNHILPHAAAEEKLPFEPLFPFDVYSLNRSSVFVRPLLRRFSPLAEDVSVLRRELNWRHASSLSGAMGFKSAEEAAGSLDFLEDVVRDRELMTSESFGTSGMLIGSASKGIGDMFTIYSASPGLRHFTGASSLMDTN